MKICPVGDELFQADGWTEANSSFSQDWVAPINGPYTAPKSDLFHSFEIYFTLQMLASSSGLIVSTITSIHSIVGLNTGP